MVSWTIVAPFVTPVLMTAPNAVHAMFNGCPYGPDQAAEHLCACVPRGVQGQPTWDVDHHTGQITFTIDQDPDIQLHLAFDMTPGAFDVTAGMLKLDNKYQRQGIAKRFARNAYIVLDDLGVDRVKVHANWNGGGYAWAKLGAVPENVATVNAELLKHANSLLNLKRITAATHAEFVQLVTLNSDPDRLLLRVAESESPNGNGQLKTVGGDLLGRHILLPSTWDGIWDLRNSARRAAIESALS